MHAAKPMYNRSTTCASCHYWRSLKEHPSHGECKRASSAARVRYGFSRPQLPQQAVWLAAAKPVTKGSCGCSDFKHAKVPVTAAARVALGRQITSALANAWGVMSEAFTGAAWAIASIRAPFLAKQRDRGLERLTRRWLLALLKEIRGHGHPHSAWLTREVCKAERALAAGLRCPVSALVPALLTFRRKLLIQMALSCDVLPPRVLNRLNREATRALGALQVHGRPRLTPGRSFLGRRRCAPLVPGVATRRAWLSNRV